MQYFELLERRDLLAAGRGASVFASRIEQITQLHDWSDHEILTADLNDDAIPDLVVGSWSGRLDILLGKSNGEFEQQQRLTDLGTITNLEVGDLNQDQLIDIVISTGTRTQVLFGASDILWTPRSSSFGPSDVLSIADLNRDGIPDVTVHSFPTDLTSVYIGVGEGDFHESVAYPSPASVNEFSKGEFLSGDLNNDGFTDFLRNANVGVEALINTGEGVLDHVVVTTMDARPEALYDFDGDGILDLVASNLELRSTFAEGSITVQPGRGDGSFAETTKIIPIGGSISHLIVGDIDGNGHADIAFDEQVDHSIIGGLTIHFSDDSGQLRTEPRLFLNHVSYGIATLPSPLNDGIDLLVADGRNRNLTAYRDLESDFSHPFADVVETHNIDNRASRHIFRDLNADGFTDVIAVGPRSNVLTIAHGHRLGFEEAAKVPLRNEPYGFLFGNFQGDEGNELAIWTVNSVTIMDAHSLSTTSFTHEREVTLALADRWLRSVAVVDSNGDGRDEILFHRYIDFAGSQQEYAVLSNHGDNWTLDPWTQIVKTFENLAIYDVNADGFPDHLYTTDRELKVHLRDGDGNTTKVTTVPHVGNDFSKERIEVSDVNLDGNADVVLTNFRVGDQPVFLGDGLGEFVRDERVAVRPLILSVVVNTPLVSYAFPARSDELSNFVYRDIDKDGDVDLLISSTGGVTVFRGTGQGDFNRNGIIDSSDIQELRAAEAGIASDLNGDDVINESDVRFLVEEIASTQLGDADLDGRVDFHDFLKLATNFGKTGTVWEQGDFNGDELTDFQDFLILAENFNAT